MDFAGWRRQRVEGVDLRWVLEETSSAAGVGNL